MFQFFRLEQLLVGFDRVVMVFMLFSWLLLGFTVLWGLCSFEREATELKWSWMRFSWFQSFLMVSTGFLPSFTWFDLVFMDSSRISLKCNEIEVHPPNVLMVFNRFYQVFTCLNGFLEKFYWVTINITVFFQVSIGFHGTRWLLTNFTKL